MAEFENEKLSGVHFTEESLQRHSWEGCEFRQCSLQGIKRVQGRFVDCQFTECDLSNLDVAGSQFTEVSFRDCKMLGIRWHEVTPLLFSAKFDGCNLTFCDFFGMKLRKLEMVRCQLHGAIFEQADLTEAVLCGSDFKNAVFLQTQLTKADFTDARNYDIDPLTNR
ncbi:MAG TPA: pentapeptide repeat-containing protein, partial [Candidatus Kapabacteria bacterium]|nr:pentapeptide repeat-containing protein [Candidatus Kapabacteria bacterium]